MNNEVCFQTINEWSLQDVGEFIHLAESVTSSVFGAAQVKLFVDAQFTENELNIQFFGYAGKLYVLLITAFLNEYFGSENFKIIWKHFESKSGG